MSEGRLPNTLMLGVSSVEATATEMGQSTTKSCLPLAYSLTQVLRPPPPPQVTTTTAQPCSAQREHWPKHKGL